MQGGDHLGGRLGIGVVGRYRSRQDGAGNDVLGHQRTIEEEAEGPRDPGAQGGVEPSGDHRELGAGTVGPQPEHDGAGLLVHHEPGAGDQPPLRLVAQHLERGAAEPQATLREVLEVGQDAG